MTNQKFCQGCYQKHKCQEVFHKLGNIKGPPVVLKVVFAFLLPLITFIAALTVFGEILDKIIITKQLQTIFSLLLAVSATYVCILIIRAINRHFSKIE